jgi:hypothetical protein
VEVLRRNKGPLTSSWGGRCRNESGQVDCQDEAERGHYRETRDVDMKPDGDGCTDEESEEKWESGWVRGLRHDIIGTFSTAVGSCLPHAC